MTSLISPSLSPNTERDDVLHALQLLASPHLWRDPQAVRKFSERMRSLTQQQFVMSACSARACLYALLAARGIHAGDEVLVQAYTCVTVVNPILWCGARPVYCDINEQTLTLSLSDCEQKITPRTKALIIQHTFGIPADIKHLCAFARRHNLFVIEDCAHRISGIDAEGRALGSFGDAAIFSFGRDKALSSIGGGIAVTHDPLLFENLQRFTSEWVDPPMWWIAHQLLHPLVFGVIKSISSPSITKIFLGLAARSRVLSKAVERCEYTGGIPSHIGYRYPSVLARLALHQLGKYERFNAHRRKISTVYRSIFPISSHVRGARDMSLPLLRFPVVYEDASERVARCKQHNIFLDDWRGSVIVPSKSDLSKLGYVRGSCPHAERIAQTIIPLPTHPGIREAEAHRIHACLTTGKV